MKRPPGLWFLLSAGVLWLSLQDAYGIRATSLIFGKSSTSTTTTTAASDISEAESSSASGARAVEEVIIDVQSSTEQTVPNVTKPTLTGIPQIDYIYDPNLPKELNGYNLTEYPFYERVPEDIDFKCDGLHDGFYASVLHKCQVYHHCLFGTRYDFLCANYTAFDQKTFICHFVSEVDCVNSKKYWHRNDALYQSASSTTTTTTTTVRPIIIYTPPPQPPPVSMPRRPAVGRYRPYRRRRPQYDYYETYEDDYEYEERPPRGETRRRSRPRPRPRPIYDDEYEEYEDERYERRNNRRRQSERRRNKDRRKYEDDDDYMEDENSRKVDNKKLDNDRRYHKRRPADGIIDVEEEEKRLERPRKKSPEDEEPERRREQHNKENEKRPKHDNQKDISSSSSNEEIKDKSRHRNNDENRKKEKDKLASEEYDDLYEKETPKNKPIIKPHSGSSLFDRPRAAPKIKPPVPKNEADKYAYKPIPTTKAPVEAEEDEEYYYDYEEEEPLPKVNERKQETSESRRYGKQPLPSRREEIKGNIRKPLKPLRDDAYYDDEIIPEKENKHKHIQRPRVNYNLKKQPIIEEYYDDYEDLRNDRRVVKEKLISFTTAPTTKATITTSTTPKPTTTTTQPTTTSTTTATTTTTTTTTKKTTTTTTLKPISYKESNREIIRIVKRPFLPSRGGNPYSSRGLEPVGLKATTDRMFEDYESDPEIPDEPILKASQPIIKAPVRHEEDNFKPVSSRTQYRQQIYQTKPIIKEISTGPRTTQKPKISEKDPLDNIDDYDVTLNDALNPTLPNLPVRGYPTGFSANNDYTYNSYQRPRFLVDAGLTETDSDNVYQQTKKPEKRNQYQQQQQPQQQQQQQQQQQLFVDSNQNYNGQYSTYSRPRIAKHELQNYYTSY